jgi:hypothetical protein
MRIPTRGKHSSVSGLGRFVSNWDEGSSQERATVCEMRVSRSMLGERGDVVGEGRRLAVGWRRDKIVRDKQSKDEGGARVSRGNQGFRESFLERKRAYFLYHSLDILFFSRSF